MPWWCYSLLANVAIIYSEFLHRSVPPGSPWIGLITSTWVVPTYAVAQYCLFKSFSGAPHWFTAWMMFAVANSMMRVLAVETIAPGEVTSWWFVNLGVATMLAGAFMVKEGLR